MNTGAIQTIKYKHLDETVFGGAALLIACQVRFTARDL